MDPSDLNARARVATALGELGFTPISSTVVQNKELDFSLLVRVTSDEPPKAELALTKWNPNNGGYWMVRSAYLTIKLDETTSEKIREWLRTQDYPVDRILRIKRLRALID